MFERHVQHINVVHGLSRRDKGRDHDPALRRQGEFHRVVTSQSSPLRPPSAAISGDTLGGSLGQRI